MFKAITGYACFRVNRYSVYIIASEMKSKVVCLYLMDSDCDIRRLDPLDKLPDVRLTYPCKFGSLSAKQRATVRGAFSEFLRDSGVRGVETATLVEQGFMS